MRIIKVLPALLVTLLLTAKTFAQPQLSPQAQISLLTCGPGPELHAIFGHTAVRVHDPATAMDIVYNFGTFDFDTQYFYLKFVKGDLQYFVSASSYFDFIAAYQYYNRDVFEQKLNLTPEEVKKISDELYTRLNGEGKYYTYKFFDRNCTTMVGDILNENLPVKLSMQNSDAGKTNRQIIYKKLENSFYENLGINLIFGRKTDLKQYKLFLPAQLMEGVSHTTTGSGPLAQPAVTVFKSTYAPQSSWWNNCYTYAVLCLALMYLSRHPAVHRTLLALLGLTGLFLSCVGFYSFHEEIAFNYNALLINPLLLLILICLLAKKQGLAKVFSMVCLGCIGLYVIMMLTEPHLCIILPLMALIIFMLIRCFYKKSI